jgi:hypothetical protein
MTTMRWLCLDDVPTSGTEGNDQVHELTPNPTLAARLAAGSGVRAAVTPRPPRA